MQVPPSLVVQQQHLLPCKQQPKLHNQPGEQQQPQQQLPHVHLNLARNVEQLQQLVQQQQQLQPPAMYEWPGLHTWRDKGIDPRRAWGPKNRATANIPEPAAADVASLPLPKSLVGVALQVGQTLVLFLAAVS